MTSSDRKIFNSTIDHMRHEIETRYRWHILSSEILDRERATWVALVTTTYREDPQLTFCVLVSGMQMVTFENSCLAALGRWASTLAPQVKIEPKRAMPGEHV